VTRHTKITLGVALAAASLPIAVAQQRPFVSRDFFYVGGKYVGPPGQEVMAGQMYVEEIRPRRVTQKYPMVFFHGGSETATNWMGTPDGRPGWADYFLEQGYAVYLVDQPARGRSAWHASTNGPIRMRLSVSDAERMIAIEKYGNWPQAKKHTQWPSSVVKRGDPVFDEMFASFVESLEGTEEIQTLNQAAGSALLDKIGPAVIVTHSQSGPFGWLLGDSRPQNVKGIVAVEPSGPPFQNAVVNEKTARSWGLADIPLTYAPPVKDPGDLAKVREGKPDGPDLATCWKQADPPRQLVNLVGIPVLVVTSEASNHAVYDQCTSKYLTQAGVKNTHIRLPDRGIHGNGHHMMLEKNNREIAALIHKWLSENVERESARVGQHADTAR
jgi:pimeloyl-ACP methyl ester carboxylesterase